MRFLSIRALALVALLAVGGTVGAVSVTPARAQVESREGIALQNQIYGIRQELQGLRDQFGRDQGGRGGVESAPGRGGSASSAQTNDLVAQLLTRVDTLEDQLRQLRGRIDELQNQTQRQTADLGKRLDDLAFQGSPQGAPPAGVRPGDQALPGHPAEGPTALLPPVRPGLPQSEVPPLPPRVRTPEMAMREGNAALARRDYPAAEQSAREVLAVKTSPRAYDGQLLLAQALFGQRQYSNAAIAFDDTYNRSRKGTHAPDALLGLSNSLSAINEKKAACGTLDKLRGEFPQVRPDLREAIAASALRAGCH